MPGDGKVRRSPAHRRYLLIDQGLGAGLVNLATTLRSPGSSSGSGVWYIRFKVGGRIVRKRIGPHGLAVEEYNKARGKVAEGIYRHQARRRNPTLAEVPPRVRRPESTPPAVAVDGGASGGDVEGRAGLPDAPADRNARP